METKTKKVDKYLTDLKELPVESKNEIPESKIEELKPLKQEKLSDKPKLMNTVKVEQHEKIPQEVVVKTATNEETVNDDIIERAYTPRDIILGIINVLSVIFLIFLLAKMPEKAAQLKAFKIGNVQNTNGAVAKLSDANVKKSDELDVLFLDDFGVVDFTVDIEKLRSVSPAIQRVSFTSQKPIQDRLGLAGIPAVITLEGSWDSIGSAMSSIESLPYLFRPVSIKTQASKEDPKVIVLNYGGILYVGNKLTKN